MISSSFDSKQWWDTSGPFKILHQINPLRIQWIIEKMGRSLCQKRPLAQKKILEIGCGGGILSAPLAQLGASVVAIDTSDLAIETAREHLDTHSEKHRMDLTYICADGRSWVPNQKFDAIVIMEVLEHMDKPDQLLGHIFPFLQPQGLVLGSTLNRTLASNIKGIILAENILQWVPHGTHNWHDFIPPSDLEHWCQKIGFTHFMTQGLVFNPYKSPPWHLAPCTKVNYFFQCARPDFSTA